MEHREEHAISYPREHRPDHEETALQRQIAATDKQIDQLVYDLYGLTEGEIRVVEGRRRGDPNWLLT
jgi:hypothetical protein